MTEDNEKRVRAFYEATVPGHAIALAVIVWIRPRRRTGVCPAMLAGMFKLFGETSAKVLSMTLTIKG